MQDSTATLENHLVVSYKAKYSLIQSRNRAARYLPK